jgi:ABC-type amino acid transport system permease subunit
MGVWTKPVTMSRGAVSTLYCGLLVLANSVLVFMALRAISLYHAAHPVCPDRFIIESAKPLAVGESVALLIFSMIVGLAIVWTIFVVLRNRQALPVTTLKRLLIVSLILIVVFPICLFFSGDGLALCVHTY